MSSVEEDLFYPTGCHPVTDNLNTIELIKRLKVLAHTLQKIGQDQAIFKQYIPLTLHLAKNYFIKHMCKEVQLLIACCIADLLRIYAPEAPFKSHEQVERLLTFLMEQFVFIKDANISVLAFKRYTNLLENLLICVLS